MAGGYSNKEISLSTHKSEGTVKNQVSAILKKLGIRESTRALAPVTPAGERQISADGYEMIFQVNYLAHYLLADLLLPLIKTSTPSPHHKRCLGHTASD